jgi:hypothetical protein
LVILQVHEAKVDLNVDVERAKRRHQRMAGQVRVGVGEPWQRKRRMNAFAARVDEGEVQA